MAFDLSFSPEFFFAEAEPYDREDLALNGNGLPISVWSAIQYFHAQQPERWREMAKELFGLTRKEDADLVMAEGVLDKIRETNTCTDIESPIEVWIDSQGDFRIKVYDE